MPDILERLEEEVQCDREPFTPEHAHCICRLTSEAADEIGKLRAQISAWEAHARHHGCVPELKFNS